MRLILFLPILLSLNFYAQRQYSIVWDKDFSVYYGNDYLTKNVFKSDGENILKFETVALAAANSGEITTVLYKKEEGDLEGLLLCFYGSYSNDAGVIYTGYGFKNLDKEKAFEFLNLLQKNIDENKNYLSEGGNNSYSGKNIYFKYDDINVLIGYVNGYLTIRLFWQNFDSSWNENAFNKSKRRFEKKMK